MCLKARGDSYKELVVQARWFNWHRQESSQKCLYRRLRSGPSASSNVRLSVWRPCNEFQRVWAFVSIATSKCGREKAENHNRQERKLLGTFKTSGIPAIHGGLLAGTVIAMRARFSRLGAQCSSQEKPPNRPALSSDRSCYLGNWGRLTPQPTLAKAFPSPTDTLGIIPEANDASVMDRSSWIGTWGHRLAKVWIGASRLARWTNWKAAWVLIDLSMRHGEFGDEQGRTNSPTASS